MEAAGRQRSDRSSQDSSGQIQAVIDTLRQQIKSKLVDEDVHKYDGLVRAVFGDEFVPDSGIVSPKTDSYNLSDREDGDQEKLTIFDKCLSKAIADANLVYSKVGLKSFQTKPMSIFHCSIKWTKFINSTSNLPLVSASS